MCLQAYPYAYTCIHTYTHRNTYTEIHTYTCTCTCVLIYICYHESSRTPLHSKWICVSTNRPQHSFRVLPRVSTYVHTFVHTHTDILHTDSHKHVHLHVYFQINIHISKKHVIMNRQGRHNFRNGIVWVQTGHTTCTCTVSLRVREPRTHQRFESSEKN